VEIYGDSYGTFFVQTFAARHPGRVSAIVLDAAYPAVGGDPWYPSDAPTIRQTFDLACRRDPRCAAQGASTHARVERLLAVLRKPHAPIRPTDLALVMDSAGLDPLAFRDLDAAARAYLADGDASRCIVSSRKPTTTKRLIRAVFRRIAKACSRPIRAATGRPPTTCASRPRPRAAVGTALG